MKKFASSTLELLVLILMLIPTLAFLLTRILIELMTLFVSLVEKARKKLGLEDVGVAKWIEDAQDFVVRIYR